MVREFGPRVGKLDKKMLNLPPILPKILPAAFNAAPNALSTLVVLWNMPSSAENLSNNAVTTVLLSCRLTNKSEGNGNKLSSNSPTTSI
ncbi:hypothetical protein D3C80_1677740 [compost metagenome]